MDTILYFIPLISVVHPFAFLKSIFAPQSLNFSHSLIGKLIAIENEAEFAEMVQKHQTRLTELFENLVKHEEIFKASRLEYEKKEDRYLHNTTDSEDQLDQLYRSNKLDFVDVPREALLDAIQSENVLELMEQLSIAARVIENMTQICRNRTYLLLQQWQLTSDDLIEKLKKFEYKALKQVSNNLRLRLLPELQELQHNLKDNLIEGTMSRIEVMKKLEEFTLRVKQDVFGDLSKEQIRMLDTFDPNMSPTQIIDYIKNEKQREDLLYLLETGKISIILNNPLLDLY